MIKIQPPPPRYDVSWADKKGETIEAAAPTMEEVKELLTWVAIFTGMKPPP